MRVTPCFGIRTQLDRCRDKHVSLQDTPEISLRAVTVSVKIFDRSIHHQSGLL